jgi:putative ubiquitin-RnfH superfamily antitoxin RatB of RatAB toxin-antitoxin module
MLNRVARGKISIEVVYAAEHRQAIISLVVDPATTVLQAIERSKILTVFPEIVILEGRIGIFGKLVSLTTTVKEGDRVEIYRLLKQDPKEARRARARSR